ncbi:MAG TPA: DUF692 domain-containing protein [Steroidobacteraceae bacterium]|nr:DUF692 domain-containing protein [Steroidobacteraceae bacterium]
MRSDASPAGVHEARRAGIGLRAIHHSEIVARSPDVGWFEAHSENYFARGGALPRVLRAVRERYPLSLHGVGLSIGSTDPLDRAHLAEIARLVRDFEPMLVSEHLCWGSVGGRFTNDLLPLPYTEEALRHMIERVRHVQDVLGRGILIENVSSYLQFASSTLTEWDFLAALARESGCGLLLDVNNVYVSAANHGFDPLTYLNGIPRHAVREIHLAGHSRRTVDGREVLIDTHDGPVCDAVWSLYAAALERFGPVPTLIEWDSNIPPLEVLVGEAHKADRMRERHRAHAA